MNRLAKYSVHTISIILVIAILLPRMPHWIPEDVSRDGKVGLQDAILFVRGFERTAVEGVAIKQKMRQMVSALQIASGIKTVTIKSESKANKGLDKSYPCLMPSADVLNRFDFFDQLTPAECAYRNITMEVPIPPPRLFA